MARYVCACVEALRPSWQVTKYFPGAQSVQLLSDIWPSPDNEYLPSIHALHVDSDIWASPLSEYRPDVQFLHTDSDICASPLSEYLPSIHDIQIDSLVCASPDIEYLPVGIVLNLKPRISNDLKSVSMQVETIITETEELTSGVLEAPIINNRKVESHVKVLNNTPFIIGGLISNKKADQEGRIPILSKIPFLGKLFSWNTNQSIKKEVIVVITPHIIDNNDANFSRVIPQDESIFDSFGNTLFPNSYRLKESDIYDLNFITESNYLKNIKINAENMQNSENEEIKSLSNDLLNNFIPGEEIITRRMLYDIIEKQNYFKVVDSDKIIFFNNEKDYGVDFIKNYFKTIGQANKGILLLVSKDNSSNDTFFRPGVSIKEINLSENYNYKSLLKNEWDKNDGYYPILLTNQKDLKRLYEILIMQEVLKLNSSLELTIKEFKRGLEIQFPAKDLISNNSFVIDENIANYFYETNFYYERFEEEFKRETSYLLK